jgi:hypothetical protein
MSTLAALYLALAPAPASLPATLILYRDTAEPLLFKPMLSIDGVELGRLGEKRFLAVALAAGPHRIEARWPALAGHRPATLELKVQPGSFGYVELTGTAAFWRTVAATALVKRAGAEGQAQVAACCKPTP